MGTERQSFISLLGLPRPWPLACRRGESMQGEATGAVPSDPPPKEKERPGRVGRKEEEASGNARSFHMAAMLPASFRCQAGRVCSGADWWRWRHPPRHLPNRQPAPPLPPRGPQHPSRAACRTFAPSVAPLLPSRAVGTGGGTDRCGALRGIHIRPQWLLCKDLQRTHERTLVVVEDQPAVCRDVAPRFPSRASCSGQSQSGPARSSAFFLLC